MAVLYNTTHEDERYSPLFEPNLYADSVFAPGVTFTDEYEIGPAGGIAVRKVNSSACAVGTPGRDFTDEATSTSLINIVFNNNFQKSKKVYGVQLAGMEADLADEQVAIATAETSDAWQRAGLACLISEGTTTTSTASITTATLKKQVVEDIKKLRDKHGKPDVILMSTDCYAKMLEVAGSAYTPIANENINASGQVGKWLGMTVVECDGLSATNGSYYDNAGTLTTATFSGVDYIMYNHRALSILNNLVRSRLIESENFVGVKAQVEYNSAFTANAPEQVLCKKH